MTKLVLVGCGAAKRDEAVEARNLYTSNYFALKRRYAERSGEWRVLSAEHGLVHPETVLEPYDTVVDDLDTEETEAWAEDVTDDLRELVDAVDEVVVLAGASYIDPLREFFSRADVRVRYPFADTGGIGEQMALLKREMPAPAGQQTLQEAA